METADATKSDEAMEPGEQGELLDVSLPGARDLLRIAKRLQRCRKARVQSYNELIQPEHRARDELVAKMKELGRIHVQIDGVEIELLSENVKVKIAKGAPEEDGDDE